MPIVRPQLGFGIYLVSRDRADLAPSSGEVAPLCSETLPTRGTQPPCAGTSLTKPPKATSILHCWWRHGIASGRIVFKTGTWKFWYDIPGLSRISSKWQVGFNWNRFQMLRRIRLIWSTQNKCIFIPYCAGRLGRFKRAGEISSICPNAWFRSIVVTRCVFRPPRTRGPGYTRHLCDLKYNALSISRQWNQTPLAPGLSYVDIIYAYFLIWSLLQ
jgi:hypothetical protein